MSYACAEPLALLLQSDGLSGRTIHIGADNERKGSCDQDLIQAVLVVAVVLFVLPMLYALEVFLAAFAGMLVAILCRAMSNWTVR